MENYYTPKKKHMSLSKAIASAGTAITLICMLSCVIAFALLIAFFAVDVSAADVNYDHEVFISEARESAHAKYIDAVYKPISFGPTIRYARPVVLDALYLPESTTL